MNNIFYSIIVSFEAFICIEAILFEQAMSQHFIQTFCCRFNLLEPLKCKSMIL